MRLFVSLVAACFVTGISPASAQAIEQISQSAEMQTVVLPAGTEVELATVADLSSKTHFKGDFVDLVTVNDIAVNDQILIPARSKARAQISKAQEKGAFGQSGRLTIQPLYVRIGDITVRLTGSIKEKASVTAGGFVGMFVLTPVISGRSASVPAGTTILADVLRDVEFSNADAGQVPE